jgi:hypothetical protein
MRMITNDFETRVQLLQPLITPVLRRVITIRGAPGTAIVAESEYAGPFAVRRWTVSGFEWELSVHLHFRHKDAMVTGLWVHYHGPVVAAPQLAFIAAIREEVESRTGMHTDADWAII